MMIKNDFYAPVGMPFRCHDGVKICYLPELFREDGFSNAPFVCVATMSHPRQIRLSVPDPSLHSFDDKFQIQYQSISMETMVRRKWSQTRQINDSRKKAFSCVHFFIWFYILLINSFFILQTQVIEFMNSACL